MERVVSRGWRKGSKVETKITSAEPFIRVRNPLNPTITKKFRLWGEGLMLMVCLVFGLDLSLPQKCFMITTVYVRICTRTVLKSLWINDIRSVVWSKAFTNFVRSVRIRRTSPTPTHTSVCLFIYGGTTLFQILSPYLNRATLTFLSSLINGDW